jgi:hypothetical protein
VQDAVLDEPVSDRVVVIIAGIRSHGGFDQLAQALRAEGTLLLFFHYSYFTLISRTAHIRAVVNLQHWLRDLVARHPTAAVDFVAQGLGGLFVAKAVEAAPDLANQVGTILLCDAPTGTRKLRSLILQLDLSANFRILAQRRGIRARVSNFLRGASSVVALYPARVASASPLQRSAADHLRSDWQTVGSSVTSVLRAHRARQLDDLLTRPPVAAEMHRLETANRFAPTARLVLEGIRVILDTPAGFLPRYAAI